MRTGNAQLSDLYGRSQHTARLFWRIQHYWYSWGVYTFENRRLVPTQKCMRVIGGFHKGVVSIQKNQSNCQIPKWSYTCLQVSRWSKGYPIPTIHQYTPHETIAHPFKRWPSTTESSPSHQSSGFVNPIGEKQEGRGAGVYISNLGWVDDERLRVQKVEKGNEEVRKEVGRRSKKTWRVLEKEVTVVGMEMTRMWTTMKWPAW